MILHFRVSCEEKQILSLSVLLATELPLLRRFLFWETALLDFLNELKREGFYFLAFLVGLF